MLADFVVEKRSQLVDVALHGRRALHGEHFQHLKKSFDELCKKNKKMFNTVIRISINIENPFLMFVRIVKQITESLKHIV